MAVHNDALTASTGRTQDVIRRPHWVQCTTCWLLRSTLPTSSSDRHVLTVSRYFLHFFKMFSFEKNSFSRPQIDDLIHAFTLAHLLNDCDTFYYVRLCKNTCASVKGCWRWLTSLLVLLFSHELTMFTHCTLTFHLSLLTSCSWCQHLHAFDSL